ncbi:polysaccharide deacetylase family protein [Pseudorhodoferax sp. Leaf267]|uniref:polysaccharide deacetylase family protein n=1 Tax=Pseudorhodoferax sp. Leaf267 TaxID=1736316 RepID=UPI0007003483|nr:polysaccharide deacetylase family protein [Pseudorhodoferax sp. Leaf267]KQP11847.1 polysaccharide deacetylase [Pseudorhodoferax sp. Leaf267]
MHAASPSAPRPTRWRPPLLVQASVACHLGAAGLAATAPALWPWAAGAVVLDHALLATTGLWPRSTWLGANVRRLPAAAAARREVAVTLDDGPDPQVTPQVLDILDAHGARATFFCIAQQAERHPALTREIVRRGHSVQNHSLQHRHNFSLLGPAGFKREIGAAQDRLAQLTGQRPTCFRAPAGLRNPFLDPVLHALDLRLVSWTRRGFDTRERDPQTVLARLTDGLAAGDIVLLHDRHGATMADGRPVVLAALPALLERIRAAGLATTTVPDALQAPA